MNIDLRNLRQLQPPPQVDRFARRILVTDYAVTQLILERAGIPADEPAPANLTIHRLRPLRLSFGGAK